MVLTCSKTLTPELGKLRNDMATKGHTDAKPYPALALYTNWHLSVVVWFGGLWQRLLGKSAYLRKLISA